MNRRAWNVFIRSATTNRRWVAVCSVLELSLLGLTASFSAVLALYFGFDVFNVAEHPIVAPFLVDKRHLLGIAFIIACLTLLARLAHTLLEAHVIFDRELWLARRIRKFSPAGTLSPKTVPRASNHYGRLAVAAMNFCSAGLILTLTVITVPFTLSPIWALGVFGLLIVAISLFSWFFIGLSKQMQQAVLDMTEHAGMISRWKITPSIDDPDELSVYARAYRIRIFLASIFSYAPMVLAILFTIALVVVREGGISINLGQAFVTFVLAQTYLGLVARLFNSAIKASAFAPAVAAHADAVLYDHPVDASEDSGKARDATAKLDAEDMLFED